MSKLATVTPVFSFPTWYVPDIRDKLVQVYIVHCSGCSGVFLFEPPIATRCPVLVECPWCEGQLACAEVSLQ